MTTVISLVSRAALLVAIGLTSHQCLADPSAEMSEAVRNTAALGQSSQAWVGGFLTHIVYVGAYGKCSSVAAYRDPKHMRHFRVCDEHVIEKDTVAPRWPNDVGGRETLNAVVQGALRYGEQKITDANGFEVRARMLGSLGNCSELEVTVVYDGDLVDVAQRRVCS